MGMSCGYKVPMVTLPLALVCLVISLATSYWINADLKLAEVHLGLWRVCLKFSGTDSCSSWKTTEGWFKTTRGLSAVGLGLCVFAVLILFIRNCKYSTSKFLGVISTLLAYLAGIGFLAGVGLFASKTTSININDPSGSKIGEIDTDYLSWAWYIGFVGAVLCIKAGVFLSCGVMSDRSQYTQLE